MKRLILLSLLTILMIPIIAGCNLTTNSRQADNLSKFIVGRWYGEFHQVDDNLSSPVKYELHFIPPNLMFYSRKSSQEELHNMLFRYEFLTESQIRLESRAIDEIIVTRDGEYLVIESVHNLIHDGRYTRLPLIDGWVLSTLVLGILSLLTFFVKPIDIQSKHQEIILTKTESRLKLLIHFVLHSMATVIAFGLGATIARELWNQVWNFLKVIPWDTIIMIELSAAMLIWSIKNIRANHVKLFHPFFSITRLLHYFNVLVIGCGMWGIAIGIIRLMILFNVGSYSPF